MFLLKRLLVLIPNVNLTQVCLLKIIVILALMLKNVIKLLILLFLVMHHILRILVEHVHAKLDLLNLKCLVFNAALIFILIVFLLTMMIMLPSGVIHAFIEHVSMNFLFVMSHLLIIIVKCLKGLT